MLRCVAAATLIAVAAVAQARPYPSKPIRLLIASSPGGGTDGIGRVMAEALSAAFKQPVVAENRGGASGMIASDLLVKSPPDGYTIMITQNGHVTNPAFFKKLPYDTFRDFTPIAPLAKSPLVLIAATGTGVKTLKELLDLSKRDPRAMNFAAAESSTRLAIEQLGEATGIAITSLPYKGTGPAVAHVAGAAEEPAFLGRHLARVAAGARGIRPQRSPRDPGACEEGRHRAGVSLARLLAKQAVLRPAVAGARGRVPRRARQGAGALSAR